MPLYDTGYRAATHSLARGAKPVVIAETGIRRAFQSKWARRMLAASFLPLFFLSIPMFFFEQSTSDPQSRFLAMRMMSRMPQAEMLRSDRDRTIPFTEEDLVVERRNTYAFLLLTLMRYPQSFLLVVLLGMIAPPLISQDLRTRAYLIYFSRPLSKTQYILGKLAVVSTFLAIVCVLPPLFLFIEGISLARDSSEFLQLWDLPLRILLASFFVVIPTGLVALAISSLTLETRYAAFGWFAMWLAGHITYNILMASHQFNGFDEDAVINPGWRVLTSPFQILGQVQNYIFGFGSADANVIACFIALGLASLVSLVVLYARVQAPMRA